MSNEPTSEPDEAQALPQGFLQYHFYARSPQGPLLLLGNAVSDAATTVAALAASIHQMHVQKAGLGAPRPTHYSVQDIHELPEPEGDTKVTPLILPADHKRNGAKR